MSKQDLYSLIPIYGKKLIDKENNKAIQPNRNEALLNLKSAEDELPFEAILENMVILERGKYRVIARTNAISLDDMDKLDQDNILTSYAEFTNGLTKPYQIFIPSFSMDIRSQIELNESRMEEEESEEIKSWLQDDIDFQKKVVEESDVIDTHFYFIFTTDFRPSDSLEKDYLKAKKELTKYIKFASDELEGIGLKIKQLDFEGIAKLFYLVLNPFSAGIQEPEFNNQIIVSKLPEKKDKSKKTVSDTSDFTEFNLSERETYYLKEGSISLKNKICPYNINDKENGDYIKLGSTYFTVYEIYDYPKSLGRLWAKKLYKFRNNIDISIHTKPIKTGEILNELDKAALRFGSAMVDEKSGQKKKAVTSIEKKMEKTSEDIDYILDELDSGEQSFFHYSMYVMVKARSLEDLNDICMELEIIIGGMRVLFRKTSENMKNALWTIMPFGKDLLGASRNMLTSSVANSFPFTNFTFSHRDKAKSYFIATHKYNQTLIHLNDFELESPHYAILGMTGAGKGMTGKKKIKGCATMLNIPKIRLIDPDGETCMPVFDYDLNKETTFAESMDFEVVNLFVGSGHKINILEPEPDPDSISLIKPQISAYKDWFHSALGEVDNITASIIDYSLIHLYKLKGFTDDKDTYWDDTRKGNSTFYLGEARPRRLAPELVDLYNLWNENGLVEFIGAETKNLADILRPWTRYGSMDMFDGITTVPLNSKRIVYNLKQVDKNVKLPVYGTLIRKLYDTARMNPLELKLIHAFEAHTLFRDDRIGEVILDMVKRLRKFGGCFGFDTQNVTDLLKTKYGQEVLKSCPMAFLLKQNKIDAEILQEIYQMTRSEALKMTTFNPQKGEGYFIIDGSRIPINVKLSDKELNTFTTNPKHFQIMAKKIEENKIII